MRRYTAEEKLEILKEVENLGNSNLVYRKKGIKKAIFQASLCLFKFGLTCPHLGD